MKKIIRVAWHEFPALVGQGVSKNLSVAPKTIWTILPNLSLMLMNTHNIHHLRLMRPFEVSVDFASPFAGFISPVGVATPEICVSKKTNHPRLPIAISQSIIYRVVKGGGSKGRGFPNLP